MRMNRIISMGGHKKSVFRRLPVCRGPERKPGRVPAIVLVVLYLVLLPLAGQSPDSLDGIITGIATYQDRETMMIMRLKNADLLFKTITFYDNDNIDLVFDIRDIHERADIRHQLNQLHHGAWYRVKFIPRSVQAQGRLAAELVSFDFLFVERLP